MSYRRFSFQWVARVAPPGGRASWVIAAATLCAGFLGILILLPPWLEGLGHPDSSAWIRSCFSGVCHQRPERSLDLRGLPLAVCARCAGLYFGAIVGVGLGGTLLVRRGLTARPALLLLAVAPTSADVIANLVGLPVLPAFGRTLSAIPAGAVLAWFFAEALTDLFSRRPAAAFVDRSRATSRVTGGG